MGVFLSTKIDLIETRKWRTLCRGQFSIMTMNTLARGLECSFPKVPKKALLWERRATNIARAIVKTRPSICCLQEVNYLSDIMDRLPTNYAADMQRKTRSSCGQYGFDDDGCVIIYDTAQWVRVPDIMNRMEYSSDGSQLAQIGHFTSKSGPIGDIIIVTTHLKSKPEYMDVRLRQVDQLITLIHYIKVQHPTIHVVLAGDFNAGPTSLEIQKLKSALGMRSAYDTEERGKDHYTTRKYRKHLVSHTIDYILYNPSDLILVDNLVVPPIKDLPSHHLPTWSWPSDHMSLAAVFKN
jgi:mRNA deadenylase 3'-5' endonuclease subunit Ccr4